MDITKQDKPAGKTLFAVVFYEQEVKPAEEKALKKLGGNMKIAGFRPGKMPLGMVKEKIGEEKVLEGTLQELLPATVEKILKENDLKPILRPKINFKQKEPLTIEIIFIGAPEVKLKTVKPVFKKNEPKADTKDLQRVIDDILQKHQKTKAVDREAKTGDRLTLDFWGEDEKGTEISSTRMSGRQVIIGSKTLIPGFEDNLIGLKRNENKSFSISFPENYHVEQLRKKPVTFHVTVLQVEEVETPELTDEFAKNNLRAQSAEEFKKRVEEALLSQEKEAEMRRQEQAVFQAIFKATSVDLAPEIVNEEKRELFSQFTRQLEQNNISLEKWILGSGKKLEEIQADFEKQAIYRLTLRFGMEKLIEEKSIKVDPDELKDIIARQVAAMPPGEQKKMLETYQNPEYQMHLIWQRKVEKLLEGFLAA